MERRAQLAIKCLPIFVGFFVNEMYPWFDASPYFLLHDEYEDVRHFGLGEVKCPFSQKDQTIKKSRKDQNFFWLVLMGKKA